MGVSKLPADLPDLTPEIVFDVLRERRRQFVLAYLRQQNRPVSLTELARKTAAWDADVPPPPVGDDRLERVRLSLHHVHLPKLADLGLVEYVDDDRRTVGGTERIRTLEAELDLEALVEPEEYYAE